MEVATLESCILPEPTTPGSTPAKATIELRCGKRRISPNSAMRWETGLQMQVNRVETDRPGYDEYRYQIDAIEHDPYVLMGYLTSVYRDFSASQAETALRQLFNSQYSLTFTEETEIRTRTEAAYRSHGLPPASPPQAQMPGSDDVPGASLCQWHGGGFRKIQCPQFRRRSHRKIPAASRLSFQDCRYSRWPLSA